nr:hypothetical protein [Mumia sp. zg.B21]
MPPRRDPSRTRVSSDERASSETSIIGGSIDNDMKALTVVPWGTPSSSTVTTDTAAATYLGRGCISNVEALDRGRSGQSCPHNWA